VKPRAEAWPRERARPSPIFLLIFHHPFIKSSSGLHLDQVTSIWRRVGASNEVPMSLPELTGLETDNRLKGFMALLKRMLSGARLALIGFFCLLLLWPLSRVDSLVSERKHNRSQATEEIAQQSGGSNQISGPVITVPFLYWREYLEGQVTMRRSEKAYLHFMPTKLKVNGNIQGETRRRGLFEVPVFTCQIKLEGEFAAIDPAAHQIDDKDMLWNEAFVNVSLDEPRALSAPALWIQDGKTQELSPSIREGRPQGFDALETHLPLQAHQPIAFHIEMQMRGSNALMFIPTAKQTHIKLTGDWPHPSFTGVQLPESRDVHDKGFSASWSDLGYGHGYPKHWVGSLPNFKSLEEAAFGVRFISPVDTYAQVARSTHYGMLFILMTFLVLYLAEVLGTLRIHPLQYLLVGCGLCLFYLLLLSFAEHVGFNAAYGIATTGIVGLIAAYAGSIMRRAKPTLSLVCMLLGLYGYLFVTLRAEDYALLMGALGLFVLLGSIMMATRSLARPHPDRGNASDTPLATP
jgi:inner membrane protein